MCIRQDANSFSRAREEVLTETRCRQRKDSCLFRMPDDGCWAKAQRLSCNVLYMCDLLGYSHNLLSSFCHSSRRSHSTSSRFFSRAHPAVVAISQPQSVRHGRCTDGMNPLGRHRVLECHRASSALSGAGHHQPASVCISGSIRCDERAEVCALPSGINPSGSSLGRENKNVEACLCFDLNAVSACQLTLSLKSQVTGQTYEWSWH